MALYHTVNGSPVEVKHINRNSSAVNYIIKDGKLVFADQGLYLTGPVNYEVVGIPTIVDGVVSGFDADNYLTVSKPTLDTNDFEIKTCFTPDTISNKRIITTISSASQLTGFLISSSSLLARFYNGTESLAISSNTTLVANTKYYAIMYRQGTTIGLKLSTDNQTWENVTQTILATDSIVLSGNFGIGRSSQSTFSGSIDLKETYIKVNDQLWFYGKNYASKNIAPVPAGYTYGTTTTSAIGYVDMRTQQFTAAPTGATIGRDA